MTLEEAIYGLEHAEIEFGRNSGKEQFLQALRLVLGAAKSFLSNQTNYPDEAAVNSQPCKITDSDGNEIEKCVACGAEISPHNFELADTCEGEQYIVQILKCKTCGALSFGWHKAVE